MGKGDTVMSEQQMQFDFYDPCSHPVMECAPDKQVKNVFIQRCSACGYEQWHYEDAHG